MRIGLDARYIYPDHTHGIGRFSQNLIQALAHADTQNTYVTLKRNDHPGAIVEAPNFTETVCPYNPVSIQTLLLMSRQIDEQHLQILHSLFPIAPLWSRARRLVTVYDLQAVQIKGFSGKRFPLLAWCVAVFYRVAYRTSIARADRVMVVSHATKRDVLNAYRIPKSRLSVVYAGVEDRFRPVTDEPTLSRVCQKYGLPPSFLLNVGSTRPHKNIRGLLQAYHFYAQQAPRPLPLALVGFADRFRPEAEAVAHRLGLEDLVLFADYVADDDLPALYSAATLFVTLSLKEGFGLPVLEAMACGTPVMVSDVGSLPEVVGDAGVLVDPMQTESVGETIFALLQDEARMAKLRDGGVARAKTFSWNKTAQEVKSLYEQLSAGKDADRSSYGQRD